ncbi:protein kinase [bacterium]|nr:protein kinase [bacterium]
METELDLAGESFPLARYIPYFLLGSGAAGSVYLARDRVLVKPVAVKVLHTVEPAQAIDFQNEARVMSSLDHSNIVKVFDFGCTEEGAPYMVLEYLPSVTLESYLRSQGALEPASAVRLFIQLAEALVYAHENGVYHRDLKPSNILLTGTSVDDARLKLIDFGVARIKSLCQETTVIQGRTLVGTPAYMSPDQAQGRVYDARSEIYSFGCVLYEAVTGEPPYRADSPLELLHLHAEAPLPYLNEGSFDNALASVITTCLAKDPDDRYANAGELLSALKAIGAGDDGTASSTALGVLSDTAMGRRGYFDALVFALGIFILASIPVAFFAMAGHNQPRRPGTRAKAPRAAFQYEKASLNTQPAVKPILIKGEINDDALKVVAKDVRSYLAMKSSLGGDSMVIERSASGAKKRHAPPPTAFQRLDLEYWPISGKGFLHLRGLPLKDISLTGSSVKNEWLKELTGLPLNTLSLAKTSVDATGIANLTGLKYLIRLDLVSCPNIDDDALKDIGRLTNLQEIRLSNNRITDKALEYLADCKSLEVIELEHTAITDEGIRTICKMDKIESLGLSQCSNLTPEALRLIGARFPDIRHLQIAKMKLVPGQFAKYMKNANNLASVNLLGVPIDDEDMAVIGRQKDLDAVTIGGAHITDRALANLFDKKELRNVAFFKCPNLTVDGINELAKRNPHIRNLFSDVGESTGMNKELTEMTQTLIGDW